MLWVLIRGASNGPQNIFPGNIRKLFYGAVIV